ncbi:Glutamate--tRNA ligase [Candidatus Annandia adelgestsuga]|uniref:Glutamate--tRNA ligase n=1 Tax=Candidatus Annandia adelgestsuga TaxID=1302411 RepID=A0A3S9J7W0_9ENTR|nr:glutamate--tRNA ligase [Candidatus Annandia adelgestsuga]AZP36312.1 Glutamate--tRNA ligase [Candidatus Annandia adelgestsuga]
MKIITRFAPSPTGYLHFGNMRTALYSWLISKHYKGKFILRIENTDIKRSSKKYINSIIKDMKWLKLNWDKGPYFQINRFKLYKKYLNYMIKKKIAYKCYCSKKRLLKIRNYQIKNGIKPKYDNYCLKNNVIKKNKPYVIRFCSPKKGYTIFKDKVYGCIKINNSELDDFVIVRNNGIPTYNFCVVIDDIEMKITHVVRGDDHINNTPKQINIIKSLKSKLPTYIHLPLILNIDGKKLSKRNNDNKISTYKKNGFFSETILNFLLRLGWSYGNKEIFNINEMINLFNIKKINKSPSIVNIKKILSLNKNYMKILPHYKIIKHLNYFLKKKKINTKKGPKLILVIKNFIKHFNNIKEMSNNCYYFYSNNFIYNYILLKKNVNYKLYKILILLYNIFKNLKDWNNKNINNLVKKISLTMNLNLKSLFTILRILITNNKKCFTVIKIIYLIKKKSFLLRIKNGIKFIFKNKLYFV